LDCSAAATKLAIRCADRATVAEVVATVGAVTQEPAIRAVIPRATPLVIPPVTHSVANQAAAFSVAAYSETVVVTAAAIAPAVTRVAAIQVAVTAVVILRVETRAEAFLAVVCSAKADAILAATVAIAIRAAATADAIRWDA